MLEIFFPINVSGGETSIIQNVFEVNRCLIMVLYNLEGCTVMIFAVS